MSGQMPPPGGDPTGQQIPGAGGAAGAGQQPSEEEIRQYVSRMRGAPVEQVVAELLQALLNSAQMKLGRKDGRLLIDLAGTMAEQARPHLSEEVTKQIDQVLSQLRMSQVEAEQELQQAREAGEEVSEPNDLDQPPPEPTRERAREQASRGGEGDQPDTSGGGGLWTPS